MNERTHLGLGHVQQAHRVTVTVEERSDGVQGLVELPLYVGQLLKHLTGRPQQHLDEEEEKSNSFTSPPASRSPPQRSSHLPPSGLAAVQVAQVENSQQQVGEVEIFVQGLEGKENGLGGDSGLQSSREPSEYLFVLRGEARPVQLVDGHHDGHRVLTVHDGHGQDALCLILCQLVNKAAEMRTLKRRHET